jgi:hypothetical protein
MVTIKGISVEMQKLVLGQDSADISGATSAKTNTPVAAEKSKLVGLHWETLDTARTAAPGSVWGRINASAAASPAALGTVEAQSLSDIFAKKVAVAVAVTAAAAGDAAGRSSVSSVSSVVGTGPDGGDASVPVVAVKKRAAFIKPTMIDMTR